MLLQGQKDILLYFFKFIFYCIFSITIYAPYTHRPPQSPRCCSCLCLPYFLPTVFKLFSLHKVYLSCCSFYTLSIILFALYASVLFLHWVGNSLWAETKFIFSVLFLTFPCNCVFSHSVLTMVTHHPGLSLAFFFFFNSFTEDTIVQPSPLSNSRTFSSLQKATSGLVGTPHSIGIHPPPGPGNC